MDWVQKAWEFGYFPFFEGKLKRRQTHRLYRDALATQWLPESELKAKQLEDVNALLAHAKRWVPYYREDARFPQKLASLDDLAELPILDKTLIRGAGQALLAEDRAASAWWKATGGSTGEPLRFAHDKTSYEWRNAMSLRGYAWAGARPGSKQAYIWGGAGKQATGFQRSKERLHQFVDRKRFHNCFDFGPQEMARCYADLCAWKPDAIVGYTNPVYEFARFVEDSGLRPPKVNSVLCAAEKVHPQQRETIARVFGADVFDTYGSREFMLIASECSAHRGLHVSMENLIVEVVDESGQPVASGETGRILVTDLHNYTMPFVRYEIGDLAKTSASTCDCGRSLQLLEGIVGRALDVIRTPSGRVIPGELFPHTMKDFPQVTRFRVVQEADYALTILIKCEGELPEHVANEIREVMVGLVGDEMPTELHEVDDIPLTPTGKHRVTVSKVGV